MNVRQATLETGIGDIATDSGAKRARRKHAAAVLEFQTDPCSTTWLAEFDARKAFEVEIEAARAKHG